MDQIDLTQPLFEPKGLNLEYIFQKIYSIVKVIFEFITNPKTWSTIGIISMALSLLFLVIIIFSLVRIREMQLESKREMNRKIEEAERRQREKTKEENPRWHYILTLTESPNESDWRVAIIEADAMLEEVLKDKGVPGNTVAELLEAARGDGYSYIQDVWEAHLVRNQIAHQGSDFYVSQVEARKNIKRFQNFFEELGVI